MSCTSSEGWSEVERGQELECSQHDVLAFESTLLAPPHRRPLSEVSSGMCQYWGNSYSELPPSLLEKDKPKREASGAPSFKDIFIVSQAQQPFPQTAQGTNTTTLLHVRTCNRAFLSTWKSEVAATQTWLRNSSDSEVCWWEENWRKDNSAIEVLCPSSS